MPLRSKTCALRPIARSLQKSWLGFLCVLVLVGCGGSGDGAVAVSQSAETASSDDGRSARQTFSLSGTIQLAGSMEQDLDLQVRGESSIYLLNNTVEDAQRLNNPTLLGGYLSRFSGTYATDLPYARDPIDVYSLPMLEQQILRVYVDDAEEYPFDKSALADDARLPMDIKVSVYSASDLSNPVQELRFFNAGLKDVVIPSDDEYVIKVRSGSFGSAPVLYQIEAMAELATGQMLQQSYLELASGRIAGVAGDTDFGVDALDRHSDLAKLQAIRVVSGAVTQNIELDYLVKSTSFELRDVVDDSWAFAQWNLDMIGLPDAWLSVSGADVRVAVIDSGVDMSHPELQANVSYTEGYDFISNPNNGDGDGRDPFPSEVSEGNYHGTHISGVIAAETDNGVGIAGIAYESDIVPIRVIDKDGVGSSFDIAQAILYAAGLPNQSGRILDPRADIINLSLGFTGQSTQVQDAIQRASALGVIIIAAAGNDESNAPFYPAAYPEVVGVGSVNGKGFRSLFSNYGDNISVMAPGGTDPRSYYSDFNEDDIIGPGGDNGSGYGVVGFIGTSFAAPHVSAVAALMKELKPSLDAAEFDALLNGGALTDSTTSEEYYGQGLLNARKAVAAVGGEVPDSLEVFPSSLSVGESNLSPSFVLSNFGSGTVEIDAVSPSQGWLSIEELEIDANGLGRYEVVFNSGLATGDVEAVEIEVDYRINGVSKSTTIPVFKNTSPHSSALNDVYIYLIEKNRFGSDDAILASQHFNRLVDQQNFSFSDVPEGRYYIEVSTDSDGDGLVFDRGEAIGAYRLSNGNDYLDLSADRSDLQINVAYQRLFESLDFASRAEPQLGRRMR